MATETEIKQEILLFTKDNSERFIKELEQIEKTEDYTGKSLLQKLYSQWKSGKKGKLNPWNSIVAYKLGVTSKAPDGEFKLDGRRVFARPGWPDIDTDFAHDKRHLIFEYLIKKYGRDKAANIGTWGDLKMKSALNRIIKALDIANVYGSSDKKKYTTDNVAKAREIIDSLPRMRGSFMKINDAETGEEVFLKTTEDVLKANSHECDDFKAYMKLYPLIREHTKNLEGLTHQFGTHASGFVLSDIPLSNIAPLRIAKDNDDITQDVCLATEIAGEYLEELGLIKFDILGIVMLTVVEETVKLIKETLNIDIDVDNLPVDPLTSQEAKNTYDLYKSGKLIGVFQCDKQQMQKTCVDVGIDCFDDIMAVISLFRPGPMDSIPDYCDRKHGRKNVSYFHPTIEPYVKDILATTYGILCVHEDTLITMGDGCIRAISRIKAGDTVSSITNEYKSTIEEVTHATPTRFGDGIEITLSNGFAVTVTPDHKVLTFSGWKEAQCLLKDDLVASPYYLKQNYYIDTLAPWLGKDEDVAYLLGQLAGDGSVGVGAAICSGTKNNTKKLKSWLNKHLPEIKTTVNRRETDISGSSYINVSCAQLINLPQYGNRKTKFHVFLEEIGLKTDCYNKKVPDIIMRSSLNNQSAFLAGLIDSDGHLAKGKGGQGICTISSVSSHLKMGVSRILQGMGVIHSVSSTHVHIYGQEILKKYIVSYLVLKAFKGKLLTGEHCGFVPSSAVLDKWNKSLLTAREFSISTSISLGAIRKSKCINRLSDSKTAIKAGIELGDLRFYSIKKTKLVYNQQFYDIGVENNHNFIANGIVVHNCYQESVMLICESLCGMTPTEALIIIKGISKKKPDIIEKGHRKFVNGAIANGVPREIIEQYWTKFIMPFSRYGFNFAHSYSYGYNSYITAFLKANYPEEFMCAYMNVETIRRNLDKVSELESECKRMGITILPRDINKCELDYCILGKKDKKNGILKSEIRPSIHCKGLNSAAAENLVKNRPYNSIQQLAEKTDPSAVGIEDITALCDAKFNFKTKRADMIKEFSIIREDLKLLRKKGRPSDNMFNDG